MKVFLNLGCGNCRPKDPCWINVDQIYSMFPDEKCPERVNLSKEPNYVDADIKNPLPFPDDYADGIVMLHVLEHFVMIEDVRILQECYRVLKPGGILRVSVPDPQRFYDLTIGGCEDWGEKMPSNLTISFMEYALFFADHKQLISESSLSCYFHLTGFIKWWRSFFGVSAMPGLSSLDNRPLFSLFVEGVK